MNTVLDMCWLDSLEFVDGLEVAYSFKVMAGFKAVDSLDAINRLIYIKFIEIEVVLLTALLTVSFRLILRYIRQKDPELYLPADPRLSILVLYFGVTIILLSGLYSPIETVIFSVLLLYLSIMSFTDYYTGLVYPVFSYFYLLIGVSLWLFKYLVYDRNSTTMVIGQLTGLIIYYAVLRLLQRGKVFSSGDTKVYLCAALFLTIQESGSPLFLRWTVNHVISTLLFLFLNIRYIDIRHFRLSAPRPFIPSITASTLLILLLFTKQR